MSALARLRASMQSRGLQAFVVGSGDAHQSEYVAARDKRRAFVSGFTGSAGTAVVTEEQALLWTDGRYFLQAGLQLDAAAWTLMRDREPETPTVEAWLADNLAPRARVGVDPFLVSAKAAKAWAAKLAAADMELVATDAPNPVDEAWGAEQPPAPAAPLRVHGPEAAGATAASKRAALREQMAAKGAAALVLAALDEIMWLFNVRGADVDFNPVAHSYAVLTADAARLYVDAAKVPAEVAAHLGADVEVRPYEAVVADVAALPGRVWVDPASASWALARAAGEDRLEAASPVALAKAVKNDVELEGLRQAHLRDGAALVEFLCWLETAVASGQPGLTEASVADRLEQFRAAKDGFVSLSFETISSSGPNGAIIHYKPEHGECALIAADQLYLCDSGGQYTDGTTDVTRTVHFGVPTQHERECFTRVLQGHIAFAAAVFPPGTPGSKLDTLARVPLWQAGLDFKHGTGHGVGAFLNVHEGPQGASMRARPGEEGIRAGMTMTDEPGYYEDGAFGIRIESVLVAVEARDTQHCFGGRPFLRFENITMAPIQTKLVDAALLSPAERQWLNDYNAEVRAKLAPLLAEVDGCDVQGYLERETAPL